MIGNYRRLSAQQLAALRADPCRIPKFLYDEAAATDDHLDIDKAWHAIHFLLNGQAWEGSGPLYDAVLGGEPLGQEDVGYGPARFLMPLHVRETAHALSEIPAFELIERFDADALIDNEIYPHGWTGEQIELDYVKDNYLRLVEFFAVSAERGQAMLLYLN
jgi:hypothetical protein